MSILLLHFSLWVQSCKCCPGRLLHFCKPHFKNLPRCCRTCDFRAMNYKNLLRTLAWRLLHICEIFILVINSVLLLVHKPPYLCPDILTYLKHMIKARRGKVIFALLTLFWNILPFDLCVQTPVQSHLPRSCRFVKWTLLTMQVRCRLWTHHAASCIYTLIIGSLTFTGRFLFCCVKGNDENLLEIPLETDNFVV